MAGCLCARASLWENDQWALIGTAAGSVGYDSNLTLVKDGVGDGYLQASPLLTLTRHRSSSDLRLIGGVTSTQFLHDRQPQQNDFSFRAVYAYPKGDNVIPVYQAELSWNKSSMPDQYLGERIEFDRLSFKADGLLPVSGKLGIRSNASYDMSKYKSDRRSDSQRGEVFVGLAYERRPGLEFSVNIGGALGRSEPNRTDMFGKAITSKEGYITLRARGELTSKIAGSVYGGFGRVSYSGGYSNSISLPVAGADLTYSIDPRRTVVLAAYSGADYAPDGQSVNNSRIFLSFTNVIVLSWQYTVRAGPSYTVFRREVKQRTDNGWDLGTEFAYQPSSRFRVALGLSYARRTSDVALVEYNHAIISLGSSYRF